MSLAEKFAILLERAQESPAYWRDIAITDFTRELHDRMRRTGVTHAELARRMGTSRPYVTKLLTGGNFTLETMVKLAMALDAVVRIRLDDKEVDAGSSEKNNTATSSVPESTPGSAIRRRA
jgi:transcriptional regulator with XRE-family HTH domain